MSWNSKTCIASAAALLAFASAGVEAATQAPIVEIAQGRLAGVRHSDVVSFKGIPYAAPPVGELRWRPPQPPKPWDGVRSADKYGAICEQKYNAQDNGVGPLPKSEDCLTLNVFAPADARDAPVMFWIHGGGFVNGSGTAALYDGTELARQGVVVVTINYRLGRLGFLAHPALTAEAKGGPVGNYGLMDMIAALKWVQTNISRFGGDPQQVTIFGESAGGIAVNNLMISPAARGLFARAIVQSGLGREPAVDLSTAERAGEEFAKKLGLANASAAALRALSAEDIVSATELDILAGGGPIADGQLLPMSTMEAFARGVQAKVPYIVGFTSLEFPVPASEIDRILSKVVTPEQRERLAASYPTQESFTTHITSDLLFNEPAIALARLHAASGQPAWLYQFSVVSSSMQGKLKGAPHASERGYVFKTLAASPWPTDDNDVRQAQVMSAYWVAFARTGNPNGEGRPEWPVYDAARNMLLDFTNDGPILTTVPRPDAMKEISKTHRAASGQ